MVKFKELWPKCLLLFKIKFWPQFSSNLPHCALCKIVKVSHGVSKKSLNKFFNFFHHSKSIQNQFFHLKKAKIKIFLISQKSLKVERESEKMREREHTKLGKKIPSRLKKVHKTHFFWFSLLAAYHSLDEEMSPA